MSSKPIKLRLGTRGSLLAQAQSRLIADELSRLNPELEVEVHLIKTTGDRIQDKSLMDAGGKGLFVKELEQALLEDRIDFAVHSYKDMPVTMPVVDESGLVIAAVPVREDARDVAVMRDPARGPLPVGGKFGTSSLRRRCQLLQAVPDAEIEPLRGNIDTRIRKLAAGEYDVIILAAAGLKRAGLFDPSFMQMLDVNQFLPAPGQGALALQCRRGDERTRAILAGLNDPVAARCVAIERELVGLLEADCHSPVAALAEMIQSNETVFRLRAAVGGRDGEAPVSRATGATAKEVFRVLETQGAVTRLKGTDPTGS